MSPRYSSLDISSIFLDTGYRLPSRTELIGAGFIKYFDFPEADIVTCFSNTLSQIILQQPSGNPIRCELALSYDLNESKIAESLLAKTADHIRNTQMLPQMGQIIDSPLPIRALDKLLFSSSVWLRNQTKFFETVPTQIVEIIPVTSIEKEQIERRFFNTGYSKFMGKVRDGKIDLLDWSRK